MSPLKYILADLDFWVWLSGFRGTVVLFLPALLIAGVYIMKTSHIHEIPTLNPKKRWEFSNSRRRAEFMKYSKDLITQGRKKFWHQPYKLYTDWGEVTVLSPECAEELRSDSRMEILPIVKDDTHSYIPGFDAFSPDERVPHLITKYLSKSGSKFTAPISNEACSALHDCFSDATDWHEIDPRETIFKIVFRVSTRIFIGEEMSKNEQWAEAFTKYSVIAFYLTEVFRAWPRFARPAVHWFMPSCWELRRSLAQAQTVLRSHIDRRKKLQAEARSRGEVLEFDDSIAWFEKEIQGPQDITVAQINLSQVAVHTSTDLLTQAMTDIAQHPKLIQPLREEIIRVISAKGLNKTALHDLKLMDSVLKESQRLKPLLLVNFRRQAVADVKLKSGHTIKKGERVVVDVIHTLDSSFGYHDKAEQYDGYRYIRKREASSDSSQAHLVSTSHDHLGFGHGHHACPGRFFAAQEIKIILCHMLLKYDWKLKSKLTLNTGVHGMTVTPDLSLRLLLRRRKEEIDLSLKSE